MRYFVPLCPDIIWGNGVPQKIFGGTAFPLDYTTDWYIRSLNIRLPVTDY